MEKRFERNTFEKRLKSMLAVDFRRMFSMRFFYIMMGIAVVIPILVLVMTTMTAGTATVDPQTGAETVSEGFQNVWQAIGTASSTSGGMAMDLTSMCNINMMFFLAAVFVCVFVSDDFKSGYCKNLFTVRARKADYVVSKTLVGFVGGAFMLLGFFAGAMLGGAIAGLPFDVGAAGVGGIVMCMISKIFLMAVFTAIYLLMSVVAKQKSWLSLVLSFGVGMLLFNMIPMITPLDSTIMNVILCLAGGTLFSIGLGAVSNVVLKKSGLI